MRKIISIAFTSVLLASCAFTSPPPLPNGVWKVVSSQDEFTDQTTKMVTVVKPITNSYFVTNSFHYYPLVGLRDGEVYVGIRSGGAVRVPVGTVQLRIDNNQAWTITPEETPIFLAPALPTGVPQTVSANTQQEQVINQAMKRTTDVMAKSMSPYTVATGDKAKSIIKEMLSGRVIKFRTVGFNQAASTTGEMSIDQSFIDALREIGITPESL